MSSTLKINGEQKTIDVPADTPLLWVLRDILGMTGTKFGACTGHVDGKSVRSCLLPIGAVRERNVTTIEGIGVTPGGTKVQHAGQAARYACKGQRDCGLRHRRSPAGREDRDACHNLQRSQAA